MGDHQDDSPQDRADENPSIGFLFAIHALKNEGIDRREDEGRQAEVENGVEEASLQGIGDRPPLLMDAPALKSRTEGSKDEKSDRHAEEEVCGGPVSRRRPMDDTNEEPRQRHHDRQVQQEYEKVKEQTPIRRNEEVANDPANGPTLQLHETEPPERAINLEPAFGCGLVQWPWTQGPVLSQCSSCEVFCVLPWCWCSLAFSRFTEF